MLNKQNFSYLVVASTTMAPKSKRSRTVTSTAVAAAAATAAEHGVIVDGKDALKALPSDEAAAPEEAVEDDSPITDVVESGAEAPFEPSSQAEAEDDDDGFEPPAAQSKTTKKTKPKTKTKTKTRTKKRGKPTASRGESNDVTVATITTKKKGKRGRGSRKDGDEAGEKGEEEEEGGEEAPAIREPAVNSDYVPIPWKGRIGYVRHPPRHISDPSTDSVRRRVSIRTCAPASRPYSALARAE